MHSLASFFVSLVFVANSLFPKSNIPQVLGVQIAQVGDSEETITTNSDSRTTSPTSTPKSGSNTLERSKEILKLSEEKLRKALTTRDLKLKDATGSGERNTEDLAKREEFKKKVNEIHDENKKERLVVLDANLAKFNQKAVEKWTKVLDRLTEILNKIKTRTDEAALKGKDVTSILAAISTSEAKIADAKAEVIAQSSKTYTISIGDESNLGQSASSTVIGMKTDIKAVELTIKDAIQSVKDVYTALVAVVGHDLKPTPTPTTP